MLKRRATAITSEVFKVENDGHLFVATCLNNFDQLSGIEEEWKRLERQCKEPFIAFQSFDWCYQWALEQKNAVSAGRLPVLQIYTLRRDGELVLVLPLMILKTHLGIKCLTFFTEPHSQYGNLICDLKRTPLSIGRKLWAHLKKNSPVDAISLGKYPVDSYLSQIIENDGIVEKSNKHCSILDLEAIGSWDNYLGSLDSKTRKRRNRLRNKLTKHGQAEYEVYHGNTKEYREMVALALKFKLVWLEETGRRDDLLSQKFTCDFLSNLPGNPATAEFPPHGALVGVLKLDGVPIGMEIGLCLNGHYYSYLGAFDWERRSLSPGKIQIEMAQEWSKSVGLKKFDFLGDPMDYKSEWINSKHSLESRSLGITLRGYLYSNIWKARLRPALHWIFNSISANSRTKLLGWTSILRKGLKAQ